MSEGGKQPVYELEVLASADEAMQAMEDKILETANEVREEQE